MDNDKPETDWSPDDRDNVGMSLDKLVSCLLSGEGGTKQNEGTSIPIVVEDGSCDDVVFTNENLTNEPVGNEKPKRNVKENRKKRTKVEGSTETKGKRLRAPCWDHFDPFNKDGIQWAKCKYCGKEYAADSKKHGNTNLNSHTPNCKMYPNRDRDGQQNLAFKRIGDGDGVELVSTVFSQADCKKALAEMIIIDELSFRFVEGIGFRRFCGVMQPKFENVSRRTITREIVGINKVEKAKLMKQMKGRRICITTDTWTSIQNFNYMCLTAHFIDDNWKLQKRILNFCQVEDHKGVTIGKKIESLLLEWKVEGIFTVTVDNASSNNTALSYLARKTKDWRRTILENKHMHVRCCAHILNLIVVEGLKEQNDSIARVRDVVRYVRSSPQRMESLKKCADKVQIESKQTVCLDVCTRWNSTYLMLEVATKFEKAFYRMGEDDSNFIKYFDIKEGEDWEESLDCMVDSEVGEGGRRRIPTRLDWKNCQMFVSFLKLFYDATKKFSGTLFVTSNCFFEYMARIDMHIDKLAANDDPLLSIMAMNMKEKFDKYWDLENINILLYVAATLDPRFKLKWLKFWFSKSKGKVVADEMEKRVNDFLLELYNAYAKECEGSGESSTAMPRQPVVEMEEEGDDFEKLTMEFHSYLEEEHSSAHSSEVDKYLTDVFVRQDVANFEILEWWKINSSKYPILSLVARDVLAMPVSTVSSESAFSTGGRVLDPFRSSLLPSMVEILVCTQNWLLSTVPISIRQSLDQVEDLEREMFATDDASSHVSGVTNE